MSLTSLQFNICSTSICWSYKPFCFSVPNLITFYFLATNHMVQACDPVLRDSCSFVLTLSALSTVFYYCQVSLSFYIPPLKTPLNRYLYSNSYKNLFSFLLITPLENSGKSEPWRWKIYIFRNIISLIWTLLIMAEETLREEKETIVAAAREKK